MATLKLALYGPPRDELARTVDEDVPEWIHRLYASYGNSADDDAAQAQLEQAGVWIIVEEHAPLDADGNVRWSHGILP